MKVSIWVLLGLAFFFGIATLDAVSAQGAEDYVGAEACKTCHSEIYESWNKTSHSYAYQRFYDAYQLSIKTGRAQVPWMEWGRALESCEECHTTGKYPNGSFILKNVQCERCHLPGAKHITSMNKKATQLINWSATLCGQCHKTSHHPQFDEWKQSGHAKSLRASAGLVIKGPKCRECHVAQAAVNRFEGRKLRVVENPEPVDCQTCHDPHGSPNELQLRFPPEELCVQCHNARGARVGGAEFHPQAEMFSGSIMDKAGVSCYECHRYVKVYESALYPRITGHTFEPRPEQCVSSDCHPGKDAKWAKEAVRVGQNEIRMLFKEAEEKVAVVNSVLSKMYPTWDGSKESIMDIAPPTTLEGVDKYLKAEFNVEFVKADRSWGFHNREKAKRMLEEVEPLTEEALELISQEVLGAVGERPEVPPPRGVCGPIAVLLLAVLPLFIIRLREGR